MYIHRAIVSIQCLEYSGSADTPNMSWVCCFCNPNRGHHHWCSWVYVT